MCKHEPCNELLKLKGEQLEINTNVLKLKENDQFSVMVLDGKNTFADKHEMLWRMRNGIS